MRTTTEKFLLTCIAIAFTFSLTPLTATAQQKTGLTRAGAAQTGNSNNKGMQITTNANDAIANPQSGQVKVIQGKVLKQKAKQGDKAAQKAIDELGGESKVEDNAYYTNVDGKKWVQAAKKDSSPSSAQTQDGAGGGEGEGSQPTAGQPDSQGGSGSQMMPFPISSSDEEEEEEEEDDSSTSSTTSTDDDDDDDTLTEDEIQELEETLNDIEEALKKGLYTDQDDWETAAEFLVYWNRAEWNDDEDGITFPSDTYDEEVYYCPDSGGDCTSERGIVEETITDEDEWKEAANLLVSIERAEWNDDKDGITLTYGDDETVYYIPE